MRLRGRGRPLTKADHRIMGRIRSKGRAAASDKYMAAWRDRLQAAIDIAGGEVKEDVDPALLDSEVGGWAETGPRRKEGWSKVSAEERAKTQQRRKREAEERARDEEIGREIYERMVRDRAEAAAQAARDHARRERDWRVRLPAPESMTRREAALWHACMSLFGTTVKWMAQPAVDPASIEPDEFKAAVFVCRFAWSQGVRDEAVVMQVVDKHIAAGDGRASPILARLRPQIMRVLGVREGSK